MKKLMVIEIILFLAFLVTGASADAVGESAIRRSYEDFKAALISGDGLKSSQFVCQDLFDYYDEARQLAQNGGAVGLEDEPQIKILVVLQMRYLLSGLKLSRFTNGRDVFIWGVSGGLIRKDVVKQFEINKIQISGDQAFASIVKNGVPVKDLGFNFNKEDGRWKIDLMKLFSVPNTTLERIRKQAGVSKIELALHIMEETYGKPIPSAVLEGSLN